MVEELEPTRGQRHAHRNLAIGYFTQHFVDQLPMNVNCVEVLQSKFPGNQYGIVIWREKIDWISLKANLWNNIELNWVDLELLVIQHYKR